MLLTQKRLRQLLGVLWLIDGLLQLQPQMFTMNMVNGVMVPTVDGQPGPVAASLPKASLQGQAAQQSPDGVQHAKSSAQLV